MKTIVEYR